MRNDKHLAIKLRQEGKSYNEISRKLEIPKTTLSSWLSNLDWSKKIKIELAIKANNIAKKRLRLINKKRRVMWEAWREQARQEARNDYLKLSQNPLFIAGIMLYWGEGDSKIENSIVRLSNTNPDMIRLYVLFLQTICSVPKEKIKLALILYPDLNDEKCREFWSKCADINDNQFVKTQYIKGKHPTKRLSYGICMIYLPSRQLKEKIFVWIDLFQRQFKKQF